MSLSQLQETTLGTGYLNLVERDTSSNRADRLTVKAQRLATGINLSIKRGYPVQDQAIELIMHTMAITDELTAQAKRIAELESQLQNTKVQLALQEQECKTLHHNWKSPHEPIPAEVVEPVEEWVTVAEYAKLHGKGYSTVAGKKADLITRQDPNHRGRWQILASCPYPMGKRKSRK